MKEDVKDFWTKSIMEDPILIRWWEFDWKFPFFHHRKMLKTIFSLQSDMNRIMNKGLDIKFEKLNQKL